METNNVKGVELLDAMRKGAAETTGIVKEIRDELLDCSHLLRVEQTHKVFTALSEGIKNLGHLMDFIREMQTGIEQLKRFDISIEPPLHWDRSLNVFKEMLSAFENKDWITLSDLIQYELNPLLIKEEEWLGALDKRLEEI